MKRQTLTENDLDKAIRHWDSASQSKDVDHVGTEPKPDYPKRQSTYDKSKYELAKQDPEFKRNLWRGMIATKYGIDPEDVARALELQDHKCGICRNAIDMGRSTHIDHDHSNGKFRGLLCYGCNVAIGHLGDTSVGVLMAYMYLKKSGS